jgi:predicted secreted hydrolase
MQCIPFAHPCFAPLLVLTMVRPFQGKRIPLSSLQLSLTTTPFPDQEMLFPRNRSSIPYWERDSRFNGTLRGTPVDGTGYVELTGSAG